MVAGAVSQLDAAQAELEAGNAALLQGAPFLLEMLALQAAAPGMQPVRVFDTFHMHKQSLSLSIKLTGTKLGFSADRWTERAKLQPPCCAAPSLYVLRDCALCQHGSSCAGEAHTGIDGAAGAGES